MVGDASTCRLMLYIHTRVRREALLWGVARSMGSRIMAIMVIGMNMRSRQVASCYYSVCASVSRLCVTQTYQRTERACGVLLVICLCLCMHRIRAYTD